MRDHHICTMLKELFYTKLLGFCLHQICTCRTAVAKVYRRHRTLYHDCERLQGFCRIVVLLHLQIYFCGGSFKIVQNSSVYSNTLMCYHQAWELLQSDYGISFRLRIRLEMSL